MAGSSPEALKRYREYSNDKYGGYIDEWVDTIRLCIYRCGHCGHHWYPDVPSAEELGSMYANARNLRTSEKRRDPPAHMVERLRFLKRMAPGSRFLDYGSGAGLWSLAAVQAGFEVTSFEPHATRVKVADAALEMVTERGELAGRTFHLIMLEQVLEHIPDPYTVLRDVAALCDSRTVLVLRVPNLERECRNGSCWKVWPYDGVRAHVMAPFEHLHGFTRRSLVALSQRAGYSLLPAHELAFNHVIHVLRCLAGRFAPWLAPTEVYLRLAGNDVRTARNSE